MEKITVPDEPRWPGYAAGRWAALAALAALVAALGLAAGAAWRHLPPGYSAVPPLLAAGAACWAQQVARGAEWWTSWPPIGRWTASLGAVALFAAGTAPAGRPPRWR
ncbi:hypothetical protein ACIQBJ_07610 [Kitasatospora sp. NPDC088391]|uniref:hypothetical protein n=1 Tax=Kitasatospora sp. NPDC088391 TaxID=3364074 RepID=UPI003804E43C